METHRNEKYFVSFNSTLFYKMGRVALGQYLYNLISYIKLNASSLLLISFSVPSQLAFFNVGKTMAGALTRLVPNAVNTIIYPEMANLTDSKNALKLLTRSYRVTLVLLCISALPVLLTSKVLIIMLYGETFIQAYLPLNITLISFVLHRACLIFGSYLSSCGRTSLLSILMIPGLVVQIFVFIFYYSDAGAYGASVSLLYGVVTTHIVILIYFLAFEGCKVKQFVPIYSDFISLLVEFKK